MDDHDSSTVIEMLAAIRDTHAPLSFRDQCAIAAMHIRCLDVERRGPFNPDSAAVVAFDIADAMEQERLKRKGLRTS